MEYNAHIPNIVDDFASDGPPGSTNTVTSVAVNPYYSILQVSL